MLLSIIVINYNTFSLTCDCIRSIQETAHLPYEIILVDNNSRECDPKAFLEVFPDIKLIALTENVGFGRANNRGVKEASGKYVLLLNSDTLVHQGTLDDTVGYLEQNPSVDILGCKVLLENEATQQTVIKYEGEDSFLKALGYFIKRNTFFVETRLFIQNRRSQNTNTAALPTTDAPVHTTKPEQIEINRHNGKPIGLITGVFLLMKKSVYEASKGFDPDFFMYYEETEWFLNRLRQYNIVYYPHRAITHFHGGSDVYKKMNQQFHISSCLFWYKMGYPQFVAYFFYNLAEIPSRLLVKWIYKRPQPSKHLPEMIRSLPYFFKLLRYSNRYGARPGMLKLNYLKKHNL